jgi:hypothetical protein
MVDCGMQIQWMWIWMMVLYGKRVLVHRVEGKCVIDVQLWD